jgi:predicted aconitase with swiveling domain
MVQVIPVMQQAQAAMEDAYEAFVDAAADNVICAAELVCLIPRVQLASDLVAKAGDCQTVAMAVLKGGVGAQRAHRLLEQLDETYGFDQAA